MYEVGFRIPRVGFRIPGTGFRIPKLRIPDSKGKKMLDSGFRIPLHIINTLIVHRPPSLHKGWHLLTSISIHISKGLCQEEVSCFGVKMRGNEN